MSDFYQNQNVTLMGLGRFGGGAGVARFLAAQGAQVTITDLADASTLFDSCKQLEEVPIANWVLGEHRESDFAQADLIVVNPAVRPGNRYVEIARSAGAHLQTEVGLFLDRQPGKVIAVTGSVGKSTTATLIQTMLQAAGETAWLGGNIGGSLLGELDNIEPSNWVVLELSSAQLHYLAEKRYSFAAGVITNLFPHHLDWHGSFSSYQAAKFSLCDHHQCEKLVLSRLLSGAIKNKRPIQDCTIYDSLPAPVTQEELASWLSQPGTHNLENAQAAAAVVRQLGFPVSAIKAGLHHFSGLPHRLEEIDTVSGHLFINDSKATTPTATLAALQTVRGKYPQHSLTLLLGGASTQDNFHELLMALPNWVDQVIWTGKTGVQLQQQYQQLKQIELSSSPVPQPQSLTEKLEADFKQAFALAEKITPSPGLVLLSPASPSFDQFANYEERGERFRELVHQSQTNKIAG